MSQLQDTEAEARELQDFLQVNLTLNYGTSLYKSNRMSISPRGKGFQ